MQAIANILQVPLNRAKFQKFRNMNAILAGIGLFMVLPSFMGLLYSVYGAVTDLKHRGDWLFIGSMCLWLVVFIGLATIAAWQLAGIQTRTLSQNLPALIIDQQGIQDNVFNYVLGRIAWSEIESVVLSNRYSSKLNKTFPGIAIVLKDKNILLGKKSRIVAMWMRPDNEIMQKRQVFIPQGRVDVPVEDLVTKINNFRVGMTP